MHDTKMTSKRVLSETDELASFAVQVRTKRHGEGVDAGV
jgi:hypothetical protein